MRTPPLPLVLLTLLSGVPACHCSTGLPSVGSIGPSGGKLSDKDCGITISVPAGALTTTVPFAITASSSGAPAISGRVLTSVVCTVSPAIPLAKAASVSMAFDPTKVPQGSDPKDTDLRLSPGGQTIRLQDIEVDTTTNLVTGESQGLGVFFTTSPKGPQPTTVNIDPAGPVSLQVGQQQQFTASVLDEIGNPDTVSTVTWGDSPSSVGTITTAGLFTAVAPGHAQVRARAGDAGSTADVFVVSGSPSPPYLNWENPLPQGNDIHAVAVIDGLPAIGANNGTLLLGLPSGGFARVLSIPNVELTGVGLAGSDLAVSGNVDQVIQDIEHLSGLGFGISDAGVEDILEVDPSAIAPQSEFADGTTAWIVGAGNDALIFTPGADGGPWVEVETPVSEALIAVDIDPVQGERVVGARGDVYRLSGVTWSAIWDSPLETLFSQAVILGHQAYAVNEAFDVQVFQEGQGWQALGAVFPASVDHVTWLGKLGSQLTVALVDTSAQPHVYALDQGKWVEQTGVAAPDQITAGSGAADGSGWLGGSNGALYSSAGGSLTPLRTGSTDDIDAISVTRDGAAYAATSACVDPACQQVVGNVLQRQSDGSWSPLSSPGATGISGGLTSILAVSPSEIFIGGPGQAWLFDGSQFNPVNLTNGSTTYQGFAHCGGEVWAAGTGGTLALYNPDSGFTAANSPTGNDLYAVACNAANDVYAAGDNALLHFDGSSWNNVDTGNVNSAGWRTLALVAGLPWVGGQADYVIFNDGIQWQAAQDPAGVTFHQVNGIFGTGPGEVYVAGSVQRPRVGALVRFDGENWTQLDPGTDHPLLSMFGVKDSSPTHFWIGGAGGAILTTP